MSIQVRATARGYYGRIREVDDEFEIADEKDLGSWMERTDGKENPKSGMVKEFNESQLAGEGQDEGPKTLSEAQNQGATTATDELEKQREGEGGDAGAGDSGPGPDAGADQGGDTAGGEGEGAATDEPGTGDEDVI